MTKTPPRHVAPLDVAEWPSSLHGVSADMQGDPLNVHKIMAHSPNLLRAWWDFRNYSVNGGSLSPRLAELVILRVGVHLGAWYEWASHVDRAQRIGLSTDVIFQTLSADPELAAPEALILEAVDALMLRHRIDPEIRAALEQHFSTEQLIDLVAIQGMYVILGALIHTWDLPLDAAVAARIASVTNRDDFEQAAAQFQRALRGV